MLVNSFQSQSDHQNNHSYMNKLSLLPGVVAPRPPKGSAQAHTGIQPLSPFATAQRFQPLPAPLGAPPYHFDLETALPGIGKMSADAGKIVFHTVGDTGGIKQSDYQMMVAAGMKNDLSQAAPKRPAFFYHLGDVVYYNGEINEYYAQFYDPYNHYDAPIFSIPGNHDGDPISPAQTSLDGWMAYFMTATPHIDPISQDAPRVTMSQPYVYFTLECPFVTIVGMYTNVPDHGSVDSQQQQWLTNEFATVPQDKALIVALHHPIYSFDVYHSGSPGMADVVQHAINDSRRVPNMVLAAHVHNYQHIERSITDQTATPFVVAGNGGYFNLHDLNAHDGTVDGATGAKLITGVKKYGYVTVSVNSKKISVKPTFLDTKTGKITTGKKFDCPANPLFLANGVVTSL
jgi:acid phosphatase type 7